MEAPEYFQSSEFATENRLSSDNDGGGAEHFMVEELLDFSNDVVDGDATLNGLNGINSTESSAIDSCNSTSYSSCEPMFFFDDHFSSELCVPYDDLAELEWLSNLAEESFSTDDLKKLDLISGGKLKTHDPSSADETRLAGIFKPDTVPVPAKARSKRSRAAPCNWTNSRLLVPSPTTSSSDTDTVAGHDSCKKAPAKKKDCPVAGEGRRCLHCANDKTPQWRTGPMGPKTLCNACGVRYKSGRLVPEYRPAASPTFVLTKHSNSHRKVLELRRQKELMRAQHQLLDHRQDMMFDGSNGEDYLIHHHIGPDFRQLI